MATKTKKAALVDTLEDLPAGDVEKFRHTLLDRREEPRVRRNRVEGKSVLVLADVLVATFTEDGAVRVAAEILRQIGCDENAKELEKATGGPSPKPDSSGATGGPSPKPDSSGGAHFVDIHRSELISRVSNVVQILDDLYDKKVIQDEAYDRIRALPTSQDKLRELYSTCLRAGERCKDIFYECLEKREKYLIDDLKAKK